MSIYNLQGEKQQPCGNSRGWKKVTLKFPAGKTIYNVQDSPTPLPVRRDKDAE